MNLTFNAASQEPAAEAVAWRYEDSRGHYRYRGWRSGFDKEYPLLKPVPLYTHPAAVAAPLTAVRIGELACKVWAINEHVSPAKVCQLVRLVESELGIPRHDGEDGGKGSA